MITKNQADKMAVAWLHAWNSHDINLIMAHYADTIEFTSPFVKTLLDRPDGKIVGKPALEAYFLHGMAKYPNLSFRPIYILPGISSITLVYQSVNNLLAAEIMELDADGKVIRVVAHYTSE